MLYRLKVCFKSIQNNLELSVEKMAVRWPCGVCGRGIGNNSIQHTSCQKWVHGKCSGIK